MPPTPFQPSHQTPFKSTLSSSQQSRNHHTPFKSDSTTQLSISEIDPTEWKYHAEGGKNVLLSFCGVGPSPFVTPHGNLALRIPKHLPNSDQQAEDDDDDTEAELFTTHVVTPLLGSAAVLPQCVRLSITSARDRTVIDTLAASIELQRPPARRSHPARIRAEALTCIYAVQDVTAPGPSSAGVLCVEIKPKWGFLPRLDSVPLGSPNAEIKGKYSRYKMHRVAKDETMRKEKFERLYDPLDLYSEDKGRKVKAVKALWEDWQETKGKTNNLRLFWNGQVVATDDESSIKRISQFLNGQEGGRGTAEALTEVLVEELSKPSLPSPAGEEQGGISVLARLAYLQSSLDPYDVEGLASLWLRHTQSPLLGQLPSSTPSALPAGLTSSLPSSTLSSLLEGFLSSTRPVLNTGSEGEREEALVAAVQAFLVSATFKDCSLLIRLTRSPSADAERAVVGETKIVDLDRKPFAKLASMHKTDRDVCAAVHRWLSTLDSPPAVSKP